MKTPFNLNGKPFPSYDILGQFKGESGDFYGEGNSIPAVLFKISLNLYYV